MKLMQRTLAVAAAIGFDTRLGMATRAARRLRLAPAGRPRAEAHSAGARRGHARITKPDTKVVGDNVVTTTRREEHRRPAPIAGLKVEENWYDKGGNPVGGDTYRHPRPLQARRDHQRHAEARRATRHEQQQYQFSHANGTIKTNIVPKIDVPTTVSQVCRVAQARPSARAAPAGAGAFADGPARSAARQPDRPVGHRGTRQVSPRHGLQQEHTATARPPPARSMLPTACSTWKDGAGHEERHRARAAG